MILTMIYHSNSRSSSCRQSLGPLRIVNQNQIRPRLMDFSGLFKKLKALVRDKRPGEAWENRWKTVICKGREDYEWTAWPALALFADARRFHHRGGDSLKKELRCISLYVVVVELCSLLLNPLFSQNSRLQLWCNTCYTVCFFLWVK